MYDSRDVAAYIAQQCVKRNFSYNNTKIQKLLYCSYGVMIAWIGRIICDETPRCWPHGPVFPKVFRYINRGGQIAGYSTVIENGDDEDVKNVVNSTLGIFGKYTATVLSEWSHSDGSPWERTRQESDGKWNTVIPPEYIAEYFKKEVLNEHPA